MLRGKAISSEYFHPAAVAGQDFDLSVSDGPGDIRSLELYFHQSGLIWAGDYSCGGYARSEALQEILAGCAKKAAHKTMEVAGSTAPPACNGSKYCCLIGACDHLLLSPLTLAERLAEIEPFKNLHHPNSSCAPGLLCLYALALWAGPVRAQVLIAATSARWDAGFTMLGKSITCLPGSSASTPAEKPCQHCKESLRNRGRSNRDAAAVDYNECIQCLECIVHFDNQDQCVIFNQC